VKPIVVIVVCVAAAVAVVAGVVVLAASDGPAAVTVGNREVSQQYVNDELREIADNDLLRSTVESNNAALSNSEGTVASDISAGWLRLLVAQEVAADAVTRRGLTVTSADRERARELAIDSVSGPRTFRKFPRWFRDRLVARWTPVAVLEREVAEDPPPAVLQQLAADCPSGRFVSHILLESETEAQAIKQQLDSGADFESLARSTSSDTGSAPQGGFLGCADGQQFVEPFANAVATQPAGVVSDPVTTQFGSHLVLVSDEPPAAAVQQLALQVVLGRSRGKAVDIAPRYGTWDRASGTVIPPGASAPAGP
jgi:parvulin-like peptidyl-prolyl isomerase